MSIRTKEEVLDEFKQLRPHLEKWGAHVDQTLKAFLESKNYPVERVQIEPKHRVKKEDSYIQKAMERKSYENPIVDMTDKVGTRVVLLNREDVDAVSYFVFNQCEEWVCKSQDQDIDNIKFQDPEKFKYQSNHFVVKPTPDWIGLKDLPDCFNRDHLTCEIQVRTLLQHVYAEISHETMYKNGREPNPKMQRMLALIMANVETLDDMIKLYYETLEEKKATRINRLKLLKNAYVCFVPNYDGASLMDEWCDGLFDLLDNNDPSFVNRGLVDLDSFVERKKDCISAALKKESFLFKHPICLLALYAMEEKRELLLRNWPYSSESREELMAVMGVSDESIND